MAAGAYDVFVMKLNSSGNLVWVRSFGSTNADFGEALAVDGAGNVYVTGTFAWTVDFDPDPLTTFNLVSAGLDDVFLVKLNPSGNLVWAKRFGGTGYDEGRSVVVPASGDVYITGQFYGMVDFDPDPASTYNLVPAGDGGGVFVVRLSSSGGLVWAKGIGGLILSESVAVDASGNVHVAGLFQGTIDFDPDLATTYNLVAETGGHDVFVVKLNSSGGFVWARRFGGPSGSDTGESVALDDAGNVHITGVFRGTVDFDPDPGATRNLVSAGSGDAFVMKLNPSGNLVWASRFGGVDSDIGQSVAVDGLGNVYATGAFVATASLEPDAGATNAFVSAGSRDIFVLRLNPSGDPRATAVAVPTTTPAPPDTQVETPTPPNPGGGGGVPAGGGGGGGGGGGTPSGGTSSTPARETVIASVQRPASPNSPVAVQLAVPAGRIDVRLTGLDSATQVRATPIDAPTTSGVRLLATAFDIEVDTTGRVTGAEVCVPIDRSEVSSAEVDSTRLSLYHFSPNPVDITTRTSTTQVCGQTTSFSPFALGVPSTTRLAGTTRYDTAASLVNHAFPGTADLVLVAAGANFPDALAASAAAAKADAPLLLVAPGSVPAATRAQLNRLRPTRIVIVGGTAAVSESVERELTQTASVERIAGGDRYETAALLAQRFFDRSAVGAYLVSGENFPDALAAGAASSYTAQPVLLTRAGSVPVVTTRVLAALGITNVTVVGGTQAVSTIAEAQVTRAGAQVARVAGSDRFDTAARLARTVERSGPNILLATGSNFPDALGAAAVAARLSATLILTSPTTMSRAASDYLTRRAPDSITVLGGYSAITRRTESQFATGYLE